MLSNDEALKALEAERLRFTQSDKSVMEGLCGLLVSRGVYPENSKLGRTALTMVEFWGAYWHLYGGLMTCPSCDADLRDLEHGPPFKRELGRVVNDRLHHYECPDCGCEFGRE